MVLLEMLLLRAGDPVFAADASVEFFQLSINPINIFLRPGGDFAEPEDAELVEHFFQHRPDPVNQFEVVVVATAATAASDRGADHVG